MAVEYGELEIFNCSEADSYEKYKREASNKNRSKELKELFVHGFGVHHAGMLRSDRNLTEKMFESGTIKVLCCTATLAWGLIYQLQWLLLRELKYTTPKLVDLLIWEFPT